MQKGFQLVELMVVVIIIGILAVIALPNVNHYFAGAHRLQAQKVLLELASKLEEYQLSHNSYSGASFDLPEVKDYRVTMQVDEQGYVLSAAPTNNDACGVLRVTSRGEKSGCWV